MKKLLIALAILLVILLIPLPMSLNDGGTVEYTAVLYKVSKVHRIADAADRATGKEFDEGTIVEILGMEVYNSVQ